MTQQKIVVRVDIHDEKQKQKAMTAVSSLTGIESLAVDMKERKITVIGDVDPIEIVFKLRKKWHTELLSVGPAKEPQKKKDDPKKESEQNADQLMMTFRNQYNPYYTKYYQAYSAEENPNSCVIC